MQNATENDPGVEIGFPAVGLRWKRLPPHCGEREAPEERFKDIPHFLRVVVCKLKKRGVMLFLESGGGPGGHDYGLAWQVNWCRKSIVT